MNFDYNDLLRQQLYSLQSTLSLSDFDFIVDSEQSFIKNKDFSPNTIYVLTKELQNELQIGVDTQPIQILILSEQDSLDVAKAFFSEFAKKYNWKAISQSYTENGNTHSRWIKQQYSEPVVLSNFNTVAYGYRSVLYMSATLYVMNDVADLHDLTIDGVSYTVLTWDLAYNMTPNTQQISGTTEYISKSVKSLSTLAITITLPVVESILLTKILNIIDESDSSSDDETDSNAYGGNENFVFEFYLGQKQFSNKKMKLILCDFGTAVNDIPAVRLGFIK